MKAVLRNIQKYWERVLCLIMVIFCILCFAVGALFMLEMPEEPDINGRKPSEARIFPWDSLSGNFYTPSVPEAERANPFFHVFTSREKPAPKNPEPAPPPKIVVKKEVPPPVKVAQPVPPSPKLPPPEPKIQVSVEYKGFYVDVRGDAVALITVSVPSKKESRTIMCKLGEAPHEGIKLKKVSENSAVFSANGSDTVIKWMEKYDFSLKK